jgi:hypothetical protein
MVLVRGSTIVRWHGACNGKGACAMHRFLPNSPKVTMKLFSLTVFAAAALLATAASASTAPSMSDRALSAAAVPAAQVARNGHGRDDPKGHRLSDEQRGDQVARTETSHGGKRRPAGKGGA